MPQLMPLFWLISNMFMIMFLLVMMLMYSFNMLSLNMKNLKEVKINYLWYW